MFFFVIGILAIVAAVGAICFGRKAVAAGLAFAAIVLIILGGVRIIDTGHTGVVTSFGRVENATLDAGPHFVAPWKTVISLDNRVQKQTVELSCFSADIQEVSMTYTVNYQISKADAMTLYSTVGKNYYSTAIAPNIAESAKIVTARYSAEDLVGMRAELAKGIEENLAEKLAQYNIEVISTSIEDMDFTDAFTTAVEKKQVATQEKLTAETEAEKAVIQAQAEADIKKVRADAEAYEILTMAEAEAEANRKLSASITDGLINYTYANAWDGKLPTVTTGDNSLPVLNINQ
jgi:regulator of protease activity HflC (stomatin/prohibitin superfamily)